MARFEFYDLPPEAKANLVRLRAEIAGNEMLLACYRLLRLLRKANFNRNQPRAPRGGSDGGQWTGGGGRGGGNSTGAKPVRLAQIEEEENPRRPLLQELLDPTAETRTEAFHTTLRSIRRLEPKNPQLTSATTPNFTPSWRAVNETGAELEAARKRVSEKIGNGHAFEDHALEFGVATRGHLSNIVRDTIGNPSSEIVELPRDRTAFYVRSTNILVIVDPNHRDSGTVFKPARGETFVEELKIGR